jgi:small subunit ribosomal protein S4
MRHAKQLISHKHIRVNGKTININSYQVKNGDLIDLVPQKRFLINLHNFTYFISNFWPIPTKHLQINYRTYQIIFIEDFSLNPLISSFPFYLNLNSVIKSYS